MELNFEQITKFLHQRYPFLLVDRILEFEKGKRVLSLKNVSVNEPYFQGHFPEKKIMPGVLISEAMAQTAAIIFYEENAPIYYLGTVKSRYLTPVTPGDTLKIEATPVKLTQDSGIVKTEARVGDKTVAKGEFSFKAGI